jgi:hypothetical protein
VILCPGLGSSGAYSFDLSPSVSLADYLAARGWDVWTVELRGAEGGGGEGGSCGARAPRRPLAAPRRPPPPAPACLGLPQARACPPGSRRKRPRPPPPPQGTAAARSPS